MAATQLTLPAPDTEESLDLPGTAQLLGQPREDSCLAERVDRAMRATRYTALRGIEITVHKRLVILAGRVPNYYMKQLAQSIALAVPGPHQVHNALDVA